MQVTPAETTCPHCGARNWAQEQQCARCQRPLHAAAPGAPGAAGGGAAGGEPAAPAPVIAALRRHLLERRLTTMRDLDGVLAREPFVDAEALLARLAADQLLAAAQVASIADSFRATQVERTRELLAAASRRGLLGPAQVEDALARFGALAFRATPEEYATQAGLLTSAQLREITTDLGGAMGTLGRLGAWLRAVPRAQRVAAGALAALVLACCPASCCLWSFRGRASIQENAVMDGLGRGTATFANTGTASGAVCRRIVVVCRGRSRESSTFCSGTLEPHESRDVPFTVIGVPEISGTGDWRDNCSFDFRRNP
jgi:hypothetical protein